MAPQWSQEILKLSHPMAHLGETRARRETSRASGSYLQWQAGPGCMRFPTSSLCCLTWEENHLSLVLGGSWGGKYKSVGQQASGNYSAEISLHGGRRRQGTHNINQQKRTNNKHLPKERAISVWNTILEERPMPTGNKPSRNIQNN